MPSISTTLLSAFLLVVAAPGLAQDFTGTFSATNDEGGETRVVIQETGDNMTGSISGKGNEFALEGVREGEAMVGTMTGAGGALLFEAQLDGAELYLTLVGTDADGQPDFEGATTLVFQRTAGAGSASDTGGSGRGNPLAAADPWEGKFSDGTLELELEGSGDGYSGWIRLGDQTFETTLTGDATTLAGSFASQGDRFEVSVTRGASGEVTLTTEGTSYRLRRSGTDTNNPLAGAGQPANPLAGSASTAGSSERTGAGTERQGSVHDGTQLGEEWYQFLAGKKATKMSSYSSGGAGGYSARTDVHLCADGSFAMRDDSSVSVDVGGAYGYGGDSGSGNGRWRIITQGQVAGIELTYANGGAEQHRLDYQDGATYVDGERWYITPTDACGY